MTAVHIARRMVYTTIGLNRNHYYNTVALPVQHGSNDACEFYIIDYIKRPLSEARRARKMVTTGRII